MIINKKHYSRKMFVTKPKLRVISIKMPAQSFWRSNILHGKYQTSGNSALKYKVIFFGSFTKQLLNCPITSQCTSTQIVNVLI